MTYRHLEGLFVDEALIEPSVLAEEEALVGSVHHESILRKTTGLEVIKQAANIVVNRPVGR